MEWKGGEECQAQALQNPESPGKGRHFGTESNGKLLLGVTWAQTCPSG